MSMLKLVAAITIVLLTCGVAVANYEEWYTEGNNNAQTNNVYGTAGTQISSVTTASFSGHGSNIDPLVTDFNGDGTQEIIMDGANGTISITKGDSVDSVFQTIEIGTQVINPVLCDINTDGRDEYITITTYNGSYYIFVLSMNGSSVSVVGQKVTNAVNQTGNMICSDFFYSSGDLKYYVFWIDQLKYLHRATISGSTITDNIQDIDDSVDKEAAYMGSTSPPLSYGSHSIIESQNLDPKGEDTLSWTAGEYLETYFSDGDTASKNVSPDVKGYSIERLLGDVPIGENVNGILVYRTVGAYNQPLTSAIYKVSDSYFYGRSIVKQRDLIANIGSGSLTEYDKSYSLGKADGTSNKKLFEVGIARIYSYPFMSYSSSVNLFVIDPTNGTTIKSYTIDNPSPDVFTTFPYPQTSSFSFLTGGTTNSVLARGEKAVYLIQGPNYNTSINIFNFSTENDYRAPIIVDYNRDGTMDYIYTSATETKFYSSSPPSDGGGTHLWPFSVEQYNGDNNVSIVRLNITANYEPASGEYPIGVACRTDLEAVVWNDLFKPGYNVTEGGLSSTQNLSFTYNGLYLNGSEYDIIKDEVTEGGNDYPLKFDFKYSTDSNNTFDLLFYDENLLLVAWLTIDRNDSTVTISENVPGYSQVIGSYTIPGTIDDLSIEFIPHTDDTSHNDYYGIKVYTNGTSQVATAGSIYQEGENTIRRVELYTPSANNLFIQSMSLSIISYLEADQLLVKPAVLTADENGRFLYREPGQQWYGVRDFSIYPGPMLTAAQQATIQDEITSLEHGTISSNAISLIMLGVMGWWYVPGAILYYFQTKINDETTDQGRALAFTDALASAGGGNNNIIVYCTYDAPGTYTQRYFVGDNTTDWSNYHDLTVTVSGGNSTTPGSGVIGVGDNSTGFSAGDDNPISNLFRALKWSNSMKLLFWIILTMILAVLVTRLTDTGLGIVTMILGLILGWYFGAVPIWIILTLVIIGGAIAVIGFRKVFTGAGG